MIMQIISWATTVMFFMNLARIKYFNLFTHTNFSNGHLYIRYHGNLDSMNPSAPLYRVSESGYPMNPNPDSTSEARC